MNTVLAEIRKLPTVTRFLVASNAIVTLSHKLNLVSPYQLIFSREAVFSKQLQVWRLYTGFFFNAVPGLQVLFDLFQLFKLSNELETGPYSLYPANYAYQLILASIGIIGVSWPLRPLVLFRPLLLCMAYVSSSLAPIGSVTSLMGLITLPRIYLPWIMLLFDLLLQGPSATAVGLSGIIVGHLWTWGIWGGNISAGGGAFRRWGVAPRWFTKLIGGLHGDSDQGKQGPQGVKDSKHTYGTSYGYNWGRGQTLGNN